MLKINEIKNYEGIQESPFNKGAGARSATGGSLKENNGITLIALIITIVLMLILASITVNVAINGGLFGYAKKAKDSTEIASEKETIEIAYILAEGESKNGIVIASGLQEQLNKVVAPGETAIATENGDAILVEFETSGRFYNVNSKGGADFLGTIADANSIHVKCVNSQNTVLGEYDYKIFFRQYKIEAPKVEGYEPSIEYVEGDSKTQAEVTLLYYLVLDDDTELVFTGLNSSGEVTTTESEIVNYMVGDNTTTNGNALKEKTIQSVLKIPETYKGKNVTHIGQNAFFRMTNIIKLYTGDTLTSIGNNAFDTCKITEVTIGKKVASMGNYVFNNCNSLKKIIYNNESEVITNLSSNSLISWTDIEINEDNTKYKVEDNVLYSIDGKKLVIVPQGRTGEFVVNNEITEIGPKALYKCTKLTKVIIGDNVVNIGTFAFAGCKITEVTIGKKVASMGNHVFNDCNSLKKIIYNNESEVITNLSSNSRVSWTDIEINEDNTKYNVEDNVLYSIDGKKLVIVPQGRTGEFVVNNEITEIGPKALYNCTKLTKVIIGDNVVNIENSAFEGCKITEVTIGKNVSNIGNRAFIGSTNLKTVIVDSLNVAKNLTSKTAMGYLVNYATTIYIKDTITDLASYITTEFTQQTSDKEGYVKYVKN